MKLSKFSYCLVSYKFDNTPQSSDLVLYINDNSADEPPISSTRRNEKKAQSSIYTLFQKNPGHSNSAFREYYYIMLKKSSWARSTNGKTIVDSGSTITFMEKPVFEAVAQRFKSQIANYVRGKDLETKTRLRTCSDILKEEKLEFLELVFQFKGGAKMELPLTNYFLLVSSSGVVCLTIVNDGVIGPESNVMSDLTFLRKELKWLMEDLIEEPKNVNNNNGSVSLRVEIEELYMLWKQRVEEKRPFQYVVGCEHWRDLLLCVE
ncbi:aspartic proteinase nepenthesin-1 [Pyrus ussuriensis x Pyrus communis]|uniref:Aspartic proteinase nepenthesin-1 n=1 Tax=Pyrus ussuriensis x Pyrus communis TaxID=2448454 RepID=A0A5N5FA46_9ROSA|nr:aspartic proteinase nepenthesin-1 [Pyrus ussuriensis x Pyrus communis]